MKRELVHYDNPVLHKKAGFVTKINGAIKQLVSDMAEVLEREKGVGIAAPQVGESLQVAIVDVPEDAGGAGKIVLINPRITSAYGSELSEEGCLSIPGVHVKVKRYKEVVVETTNMDGSMTTLKAGGLFARALQHEIDHLNGILIVDKVRPVRRFFIKRAMARKETM